MLGGQFLRLLKGLRFPAPRTPANKPPLGSLRLPIGIAGTQAVGAVAGTGAGASQWPSLASAFSTAGMGGTALEQFKEMGLGAWFLVDLALNLGGWAVAAALKTEKFYDLVGSVSFLSLTCGSLALNGVAPRKILVSAMVGVWALRLGSYLVARVHKTGKDSRFDDVKDKPATFLVYWTMQAVWVFVTLCPVLLINCAATAKPLTGVDAIGVAIWALGLGLEAISDRQKDVWRSKPENKGRFITDGLWSLSRHPNYLGEIILWWGVFFTCVGGFTKPQHLASIVSPITVFLLLRFVSGVPILEKQADARWGTELDYLSYKEKVPMLWPTPTSCAGALSSKDK